jgi:uncharacterized membrane protein YciS (DUF1049 family)
MNWSANGARMTGLQRKPKERAMTIMTAVVMVGLLATVAVLITGIASMARGGDFDLHHSHQLMAARVGFQAVTLLAVLIAVALALR